MLVAAPIQDLWKRRNKANLSQRASKQLFLFSRFYLWILFLFWSINFESLPFPLQGFQTLSSFNDFWERQPWLAKILHTLDNAFDLRIASHLQSSSPFTPYLSPIIVSNCWVGKELIELVSRIGFPPKFLESYLSPMTSVSSNNSSSSFWLPLYDYNLISRLSLLKLKHWITGKFILRTISILIILLLPMLIYLSLGNSIYRSWIRICCSLLLSMLEEDQHI